MRVNREPILRNQWKTRTTRNFPGIPVFPSHSGHRPVVHRSRSETCRARLTLRSFVPANDSTYYLHPCRHHHDRTVTGLCLASLHDGNRGARQVSEGAYLFAPTLLERWCDPSAFATTPNTRRGACAAATTRTRGRACAFATTCTRQQRHRPGNPMSIFAMRVAGRRQDQTARLGDV